MADETRVSRRRPREVVKSEMTEEQAVTKLTAAWSQICAIEDAIEETNALFEGEPSPFAKILATTTSAMYAALDELEDKIVESGIMTKAQVARVLENAHF